MKTKILAKRTNYLVLVVILLYIASQLIIRFALGYELVKHNYYLIIAFNQLFIILLPVLLFIRQEEPKPDYLKVKSISILETIMIILMALTSSFIASAFNSIVIFLMEQVGPVVVDTIPAAKSPREFWLQVFVIALLPAVCEEFFFRGIVYNAYKGLGVKRAIMASALYFALIHFDIRNFLGPFFLGILIAWYYYRTGSILAASLAHFTNNFLSILINYASSNETNTEAFTFELLIDVLMFASVAGVFLFIIVKAFEAITRHKVESKKDPERTLALSILIHWPMLIFYGLYLFLTINQIIP